MTRREEYLNGIIEKYSCNNITEDMLIELVSLLADSGKKNSFNGRVFDFASTGGPSSLTTLLVPLYLYGMGVNVINLAVPGRPAGAVDVLAQIPKYNLNMDVETEMKSPFYIHIEANDSFVPLDRELFMYRKRINKIDIPNLAIASILSKKIASGATDIGLEVRYSNFGNFGHTWDECKRNANRYNNLARRFGLTSLCFVTDGSNPYQKYIGRGESLIALNDIFENKSDSQLCEHNLLCKQIALEMVKKSGQSLTNTTNIKDSFEANLEKQGSSMKEFYNALDKVDSQPTVKICANKSGYIYYNLKEIRNSIVDVQNSFRNDGPYPDPCGVVLYAKAGDYVEKGTLIYTVRKKNRDIEVDTSKMHTITEKRVGDSKNMEVL